MATKFFENETITLWHGLSSDIIPQVGEYDLVLTDPPYATKTNRPEWKVNGSVELGLHLASQNISSGGAMLVFSTSSARGIQATIKSVQLPFRRVLVWHKKFVNSPVAGPWRWDVVLILAFGKAVFGRPQFSSMIETSGPVNRKAKGTNSHPAELQHGIGDWLFAPFADRCSTVLDPFVGTGRLLLPGHRAGKKVIGIDISEVHLATAKELLLTDYNGEA